MKLLIILSILFVGKLKEKIQKKEASLAGFNTSVGIGNSYYKRGGYYSHFIPLRTLSTFCTCKIWPYSGYYHKNLVSPYISMGYNFIPFKKIKNLYIGPKLTYMNLGENLYAVHDSIIKWNPNYQVYRFKENVHVLFAGVQTVYQFKFIVIKGTINWDVYKKRITENYKIDNTISKSVITITPDERHLFFIPEFGVIFKQLNINFLYLKNPKYNKYYAFNLSYKF